MKIRLLAAGFEDFTGALGPVFFESGLSVEPVSQREALRIGSSFHVEYENGEEVSAAATIANAAHLEAPILKVSARASEQQSDEVEKTDSEAQAVSAEPTSVPAQIDGTEKSKLYTREYLESVADAKGIAGLREIGAKHNVTAKGIESMIERLLEVEG